MVFANGAQAEISESAKYLFVNQIPKGSKLVFNKDVFIPEGEYIVGISTGTILWGENYTLSCYLRMTSSSTKNRKINKGEVYEITGGDMNYPRLYFKEKKSNSVSTLYCMSWFQDVNNTRNDSEFRNIYYSLRLDQFQSLIESAATIQVNDEVDGTETVPTKP